MNGLPPGEIDSISFDCASLVTFASCEPPPCAAQSALAWSHEVSVVSWKVKHTPSRHAGSPGGGDLLGYQVPKFVKIILNISKFKTFQNYFVF